MIATNPASSGPAGSLFEGQVGAHYLLRLLKGAEPRGLPGARISSVEFQRGAEGHPLDDIVVHAYDRDGEPATLEIQVKRNLTFTQSDQGYRKVVAQIAEAARADHSIESRHEFAIAVARGTQAIDGPYQDVLSWARRMESAEAFITRICRPGSANHEMRKFLENFRSNLEMVGADSDDEAVWRLLSRLQILRFDFTAQGSSCEQWERESAAYALNPGDSARAGAFRDCLIKFALDTAAIGGQTNRDELREYVQQQGFRLAGQRRYADAFSALTEASRHALADIEDRTGNIRLMRSELVRQVREALDHGGYVEIRGDAGVGKSGLLKHVAQQVMGESAIMMLSSDRTVAGGWGAWRTQLNFDGTAQELLIELALSGGAFLFIDGLDFFSQDKRLLVVDLVREAAEIRGCKVIATARREFGGGDGDDNWLPEEALDKLVRVPAVWVEELSEAEINDLRELLIAPLLADTHPARDVARNLFRLARLVKQPEDTRFFRTEVDMAVNWWETADGDHGGRRERQRLLRTLAEQALSMDASLNSGGHPAGSIDSLVTSQTLLDHGGDDVAFRHDIFRDWAIANFLHSENRMTRRLSLDRPVPAGLARGVELAARLAVERSDDGTQWRALLAEVSKEGAHGSWRRCVLLALVRSEIGLELLSRVSTALLDDEARLAKELIRTVMAVEVKPISEFLVGFDIGTNANAESLDVPYGYSWPRLILWLLSLDDTVPGNMLADVTYLFTEWSSGTFGGPISKDLAKWFYRRLIQDGETPNHVSDICTGFLSVCHGEPSLAKQYLKSLMGLSIHHNAVSSVMEQSLSIAKAAPEELAELTISVLCSSEDDDQPPLQFADHVFSPPAPDRGPFLDILTYDSAIGVKLIRRLIDRAVELGSGGESHHAITVFCTDGERRFTGWQSYAWSREWGGASFCLQSALMALELWAHRRIEAEEHIENILADMLPSAGGSSAYLLVAVDLLISHWPKSREAAVPFLSCPELLCLDLQRSNNDRMVPQDPSGTRSLPTKTGTKALSDDLKKRVSRQYSLVFFLGHYATHGPDMARDKLARFLSVASERLGPYGKDMDLGDPEFMVFHARNRLDPSNWKKIAVLRNDDMPEDVWRYVETPEEELHLAPGREQVAWQIADAKMQAFLHEAVENPSASSPDMAKKAAEWTKRPVPLADTDEEQEARLRNLAMVAAAVIVVRDGDNELLVHYREWARGVLLQHLAGNEDRRSGHSLRFNPAAMAFVGVAHLLRRQADEGDLQALLEAAGRDDFSAAFGFQAVAEALAEIDERVPRALLRIALAARIHPDRRSIRLSEISIVQQNKHRPIVNAAMEAELSWLNGRQDEPDWPSFPKELPYAINIGFNPFKNPEHPTDRSRYRVEHRGAGSWLRSASSLFDVASRPWLRKLADAYKEWTAVANGSELERDDCISNRLWKWNSAYFDLVARCLPGMEPREVDRLALTPIRSLPDESFFHVVRHFLPCLDEVYFNDLGLGETEAVRVRSLLAERLMECRGWHRMKNESAFSVEANIGPAIAAFFLNEYHSVASPSCYLPEERFNKLNSFLKVLERLSVDAPYGFVAVILLNLLEISPRQMHLSLILTAAEAWLSNHPTDIAFWIDGKIAKRLCVVLEKICSKNTENHPVQRQRIENIVSALVGIGSPEAARFEKTLASVPK